MILFQIKKTDLLQNIIKIDLGIDFYVLKIDLFY